MKYRIDFNSTTLTYKDITTALIFFQAIHTQTIKTGENHQVVSNGMILTIKIMIRYQSNMSKKGNLRKVKGK